MRLPARVMSGRLHGAVWTLGIVSLLMDFSSELIHGLLPIYLTTTLGVGAMTLGWIEGVAEATAMIVKIFSGTISDAMTKRKPLLLLGYGLAALTKPLFPLASGAGLVFTARFMDRIGKGIRGAPRDALIADITAPAQQGAAYGLRQALDTVGAIVGPLAAIALIAGVFGFSVDMRGALWFAVIPAAGAWLLLLFALREPDRPHEAKRRDKFRIADLKKLGRACWLVVALGAIFQLARFSEAFLVLRVSSFDPSPVWGPAALAAMSVVYAMVAYPAGLLADRIDKRLLLGAGLLVLIASDAVLAWAPSLYAALAGAAIWGLHMGLTQGVLSAMVAAAAPANLRGSAFGVFSVVSGFVLLAASVLAGALWEHVSPASTFIAGGVVCLAALVGLPFVGPVRQRHD
jgi:MFS family permease